MKKHKPDRSQFRILLLEGIHSSAVNCLEASGYTNIDYRKESLNKEALSSLIPNYHFLGIRSRTQLCKEIIQQADQLLAIGCFCIGTNHVDLRTAKFRGIPVFNSPYSNTRSVAEYTIACIISLFRGLADKNRAAHQGQWLKTAKNSHEIRGKKLGIVGYGNIGTQVGVLAEAMGMRVFYYDIEDKLPLGNAEPTKDLETLLTQGDVITIHVPETPQTKELIGKSELNKMKKGTFLINCSRGSIVDIDSLSDALESEHLGGAAIDVFPEEPKNLHEPFSSPLQNRANVILSPHIGGSTQEAQEAIGINVAQKLITYSDIGDTSTALNIAQVHLPDYERKHRFLHIHHNQPGVLAAINQLFSEAQINVVGQYLQTDAEIGYVVTDIDQSYEENGFSLFEKLQSIPGTIRTRVL